MPDFDILNRKLGDLEFLRKKELDGDLINLLSAEFTTNADQVTFTPASGKTFFHIESKLYPVVDTIAITQSATNRRADVELTFDAVIKDVLTYDFEHTVNTSTTDNQKHGQGQTGQFKSNIFESMVGNGIKVIKLTSTNNSGTYRVSLTGWIEDT